MVNLDDLAAKTERIIADYLEIDADKVIAESTLADLNVDSLETIEIIMTLEDVLKIKVPDTALSGIETVQDLVVLFYKHQKAVSDSEFGSFN